MSNHAHHASIISTVLSSALLTLPGCFDANPPEDETSAGQSSDSTAGDDTPIADGDTASDDGMDPGEGTTTTDETTTTDGVATSDGSTTDGSPTGTDDGATPVCGDGIIDPGEDCDGMALAGSDCGDFGLFPGEVVPGATLGCAPDCTFDTSACTAAKLVFLSETVIVGGLIGGIAEADAICQGEAEAQGFGGAYQAWMSDSNSSPSTTFVQSSDPYLLINGAVVAADWGDLTDGALPNDARIAVTAAGVQVSGDQPGFCRVWTGTLADGTPEDQSGNCDDWTDVAIPGAVGFWDTPSAGGACDSNIPSQWSGGNAGNLCSEARRIYCFQQ